MLQGRGDARGGGEGSEDHRYRGVKTGRAGRKTFRYGTVVYRSLDAHHFMNLELEKKVEEYKERFEDLEDRYKHVVEKLEKIQCFIWDVESQNCEYEEHFKKIAAAATLRYNDPPTSFRSKPITVMSPSLPAACRAS